MFGRRSKEEPTSTPASPEPTSGKGRPTPSRREAEEARKQQLKVPKGSGKEARAANLVFVVGAEPNQLVVGGLSLYSTDLNTITTGQSTIRPIIGGSGIYSGARGSVESTNLGDQGWRHVFRLSR